LDAVRGCSHLPFGELTKLVTGFCHCGLLGCCVFFTTEELREKREKKERREMS
jgi:hypothetical protein